MHSRTNRLCAMRGLNSDLVQMADEAGIDQTILDYLKARKAMSIGVLGAMARTWDEVDKTLVQPLLDGYEHDGVTHKVDQKDAALAKAQIRFLWKKSHDSLDGTPAPTSNTATPPSSGTNAASSKQPPKEIPPDILRELLAKYEDQQIDGIRREFPQRMLLGADKVLSRLWWEKEQKAFSPIGLHELLTARVFDAAGNPNPLAQQMEARLVAAGSSSNTSSDEPHWTPKGVLALLDALEAIEWAFILLRMGTEAEVRAWISWWRCLVRTKTQKLEQIKQYWLEANWKVCLEMRQGTTFAEVTKQVMTEQHSLQSALQKELPLALPKPKPTPPTKQPKTEPYRATGYNQGKGTQRGRWANHDQWSQRQPQKHDTRYSQPYRHSGGGGTGGYPTG